MSGEKRRKELKPRKPAAGSHRENAGKLLAAAEHPGLARSDALQAAAAGTVMLKLEFLERLCASGRWIPVETEYALSQIWGVARATVSNWVGEAWRRLATMHSPERSEEIRAEFLARIRVVGDAALNRKREALTMEGEVVALADPDCRTALQAVVEMATLVGIREQRWRGKVDVSAMSEEAILEQLEKQGYSVAKRSAAVLTEGEEVEKKP